MFAYKLHLFSIGVAIWMQTCVKLPQFSFNSLKLSGSFSASFHAAFSSMRSFSLTSLNTQIPASLARFWATVNEKDKNLSNEVVTPDAFHVLF